MEELSTWQVVLIIIAVLGFIISPIMALKHFGNPKITPEMKKKIEENNRRYDATFEDEQDK